MAKGDSSTQARSKGTLLVVDDERSLRFSIGEWARDEGYAPLEAATGREALEIVRERGVDAVVLDLKLGDEDGLRVLRDLRDLDPMSDNGSKVDLTATLVRRTVMTLA